MPWLEYLVPAIVLVIATPSVAIAFIYAHSQPSDWGRSMLRFLVASAGVSLLTALGVFLKASAIVEGELLFLVLWHLVFLVLAIASWFAILTALQAVSRHGSAGTKRLFAFWSLLAYALILPFALKYKQDLYFPYIGGIYAMTAFYLFLNLAAALFVVLRNRGKLSVENEETLRRFLRFFPPICAVFLIDEVLRSALDLSLPWPPLLSLAPLTLYVFSGIEMMGRLRRLTKSSDQGSEDADTKKKLAVVAARCKASPLTVRERSILSALLKGDDNATIARSFGISPSTVKNHVYNIFQKTGAGSRSELLLFADAEPEAGEK